MLIRILIALAVMVSTAVPSPAPERSLGDALKKIFSTPTPTPKPRKKKSAVATKKKSPTPTPTPKESSSPSATPLSKKKQTPSVEEESPSPPSKKKKTSPSPSPSASPHRKKKGSPSPQSFETPSASPSETPSPTPSMTPGVSPSPTPPKKHGAPNATLLPDQVKGFDNYPPKVQKLLTSALELTTRNLDYKYGSADPSSGGMDCSGFVYFVLKQNDIGDVPRDSSEQYSWLRRARQFESVLSQKDDSFELENLRPGDLLFWTGTYSIDRDPPITHAMIYLGREKKTGKRVMVGASDGRVYQGESRFGVSVFDFTIPRPEKNGNGKLQPQFVGFAHIPGLHTDRFSRSRSFDVFCIYH